MQVGSKFPCHLGLANSRVKQQPARAHMLAAARLTVHAWQVPGQGRCFPILLRSTTGLAGVLVPLICACVEVHWLKRCSLLNAEAGTQPSEVQIKPANPAHTSANSSILPWPKDELPKNFNAVTAEPRIYQWWQQCGFFKPREDAAGQPFVISMPPPNVTGRLHMGHAMFATLQVDQSTRCMHISFSVYGSKALCLSNNLNTCHNRYNPFPYRAIDGSRACSLSPNSASTSCMSGQGNPNINRSRKQRLAA